MRRLASLIAGSALLAALTTAAQAQNSANYGYYQSSSPSQSGTDFLGLRAGSFTAGVEIGTLGIGPQLGYRPLSMLGFRVDADYFSFSDSFRAGHVQYNATAHLESYGALADFYPFGESFRLTGGLRLNENDIRGESTAVTVGTPAGQVTVPTAQFGTLGAKVTFDKLSPYVGFGWGGTIAPGLNFTGDFGVMFNGNPKASVDANGPAAALAYGSGGVATARSDLQGYVDGYEYYPVIEIGLVYKF